MISATHYNFSMATNRWIFVILIVSFMLIGCGPSSPESTPSTEHPTDISHSPEWAKSAIWYQIFPERFRNGDPTNDPTAATLEGTWPYAIPEGWQISPWSSDWYKLQPWEKATGEDFWYNSQLRRYGGDLQGVMDKLDYLSDLGINAIYLNPIFESPSLHKYGCSMWHHVDNNFGPDPVGDETLWKMENPADPETWKWTAADSLFLKLIDQAHSRDIRVIIDGVFNHTGIPFWAFDKIRETGPASEYADWFTILSYDDPATPEDEFDWQGWYGVKDLPELAEDAHGPVAGAKQHIHAVVKRWMDPDGDGDPSDGIDGWRLDVAEMVAKDFWREFRVWCREINPESYLVGEVWWENFQENKMVNAAPWLQGDIFDAVMNYRTGDALFRGMIDEKWQVSAEKMDVLLAQVRNEYPVDKQYVLMSNLDSHDTERIASAVSNPDRAIDHNASSRDHKEFFLGKPSPEQQALQRVMLTFQFAYVGAPFVYYGDEVGMWGADDPDCRKPMVWDDIAYEAEITQPYGLPYGPYEISQDEKLFEFYRRLIQVRRSEPSLNHGDYKTVIAEGDGHFAFERSFEGETILAAFNYGSVDWTPGREVFGDKRDGVWLLLLDSNGAIDTTLSSKSARIYKYKAS
ncbi:MAG: glycoside hydrolase family 13 protein [Candidatus Marinimicrobia bacterium]|nr:glycoside hydrolase family 13 protein [Candidatus Neomarinimicrobiota bacterium]